MEVRLEDGKSRQTYGCGSSIHINDKEFKRLSSYIEHKFGIKMPRTKKIMLQARLQKRLKALSMNDFKQYNDFLFSIEGQDELQRMIDEVSTNKTDFFRERVHFDFLISEVLDNLLKKKTGNKKLSIWSAGCSTGEEPYSIAITLNEYQLQKNKIDYQIIATDISSRVLEQATNGIFPIEKTSLISEQLKKKYFQKGRNSFANKARIKYFLREKIIFQFFNLLSFDYQILGKQDIIFCRNVLIYFDRELQYKILNRLCQLLKPGGFLFLGHSESTIGFSLPVAQIKPSIYVKL